MLRRSFAVLAVAAALAGGTALGLGASPAAAQMQHRFDGHDFSMSRHVEGRIAYAKAELKITDAQAPLWNKVADTMRQNAKAMDDAMAALKRDPNAPAPSAVERLELRSKIAQIHAQGSQQLLAAFKPLYDAMSADQKKAADELLDRHHFGHHR
jgi:hypothetical protein